MDKIPCPACRTPLDAEMTSCPICMRPRSKYEITRAYSALREENARRKRLPLIAGGWLLLAAAAAYAAWAFRAPLLSAAAAARAKASLFAEEAMDPRHLVKRGPEPPAAAPAAEPAAVPPAPPSAAPAAAPAAPSAPEAPALEPKREAVMPAAPRQDTGPVRLEDMHIPVVNPTSQWILYGRAYDLATLRPAGNVQLMFQSTEGGTVSSVTTDNSGRYAAVLPRLTEGAVFAVSADPRYATTVLDEPDIPYRTLSGEERRSIARSALDGDVRPTAISDPSGDPSLSRDLFLAPAR